VSLRTIETQESPEAVLAPGRRSGRSRSVAQRWKLVAGHGYGGADDDVLLGGPMDPAHRAPTSSLPAQADGYKDTGQALSGSCRPERHGSSVHCEKGNAATGRSVRSVSTKDATRVQPAHRQTAHAPRHDWGMQDATAFTVDVTVAVVVDVLSFTTTLSVAADAGIAILPYRWADDGAAGFARDHDAVLAVGRLAAGPGQISLSAGRDAGGRRSP